MQCNAFWSESSEIKTKNFVDHQSINWQSFSIKINQEKSKMILQSVSKLRVNLTTFEQL